MRMSRSESQKIHLIKPYAATLGGFGEGATISASLSTWGFGVLQLTNTLHQNLIHSQSTIDLVLDE